MFSREKISLFVRSTLIMIQLFMSQQAFSEKRFIVTRESDPWLKTVFIDSMYGALVGGLGYGAYGLITKDFKEETLATSVGTGFFVGMIIGIFDAINTDSTALINYDSKRYALSLPKPHILINSSHQFGAKFPLLDVRF